LRPTHVVFLFQVRAQLFHCAFRFLSFTGARAPQWAECCLRALTLLLARNSDKIASKQPIKVPKVRHNVNVFKKKVDSVAQQSQHKKKHAEKRKLEKNHRK